MKTYTFLSLAIFFFSLTPCFGQFDEWAPVGAEWYFRHTFFSFPEVTYNRLWVDEEVLFEGKLCRVIRKERFSCNFLEANTPLYTYEEDGKVWLYNEYKQRFTMMYDFQAAEGDEYYLVPWSILHETEIENFAEDTVFRLRVDSVRTIPVQGQDIRVQYISSSANGEPGQYYSEYTDVVAENIGSFIQLFNWDVQICDAEYDQTLRCFGTPATGLFQFGNEACFLVSAKEIMPDRFSIQVSPNPSSGSVNLTIDAQASQLLQIRIHDASGQWLSDVVPTSDNSNIQLPNSGLFLLEFRFENGSKEVQRVIVTR